MRESALVGLAHIWPACWSTACAALHTCPKAPQRLRGRCTPACYAASFPAWPACHVVCHASDPRRPGLHTCQPPAQLCSATWEAVAAVSAPSARSVACRQMGEVYGVPKLWHKGKSGDFYIMVRPAEPPDHPPVCSQLPTHCRESIWVVVPCLAVLDTQCNIPHTPAPALVPELLPSAALGTV